jgi:hypothetical protein
MRIGMAWLFASLALAACGPRVECTSQVTEGRGTFRGHARGRSDDAELRRASVRDACARLCEATANDGDREACPARCAVDVASAKIGARTSCKAL